MSSLLLPLSLISAFFAVLLAGVGFDIALGDRRRAVRVLQTQVGPIEANLREQELARPFLDRALLPSLTRLRGVARRLTPLDMRRRIARNLVLAGNPKGWDAEKVAALKVIGAAAGAAAGWGAAVLTHFAGLGLIGFVGFLGAIGYTAPDAILAGKVRARQKLIRNALPDTMDLLTISVEAGLGFDAALAHVMRNSAGPLAEEIARMMQEIQLGEARAESFRHLAERTDVEDLNAFVLAMVQADIFGVSISRVLRTQAKELRTKRRQRAEETAMKMPVKILFPMIFCVMPSLFTVIGGPAAIRIFSDMFGAG
ncbi:MAG: type II secretion system F family protein [Acidobacteria bacterium]|nr:type II secretion system F family protein [Acidobacteriota bacterium]